MTNTLRRDGRRSDQLLRFEDYKRIPEGTNRDVRYASPANLCALASWRFKTARSGVTFAGEARLPLLSHGLNLSHSESGAPRRLPDPRSRMHQPLCCERVEVLMGDYLEGEVPRHLLLRIESHLAVCPECWSEVQALRHTITTMGDIPREPAPPHLRSTILAAARRAIRGSPVLHPGFDVCLAPPGELP